MIYMEVGAAAPRITRAAYGTNTPLRCKECFVVFMGNPKLSTQVRLTFTHKLTFGGFSFTFSTEFRCTLAVLRTSHALVFPELI